MLTILTPHSSPVACSDHTEDSQQLQSLNDALENKAQKIEETKLRLKVTTQRARAKVYTLSTGLPFAPFAPFVPSLLGD